LCPLSCPPAAANAAPEPKRAAVPRVPRALRRIARSVGRGPGPIEPAAKRRAQLGRPNLAQRPGVGRNLVRLRLRDVGEHEQRVGARAAGGAARRRGPCRGRRRTRAARPGDRRAQPSLRAGDDLHATSWLRWTGRQCRRMAASLCARPPPRRPRLLRNLPLSGASTSARRVLRVSVVIAVATNEERLRTAYELVRRVPRRERPVERRSVPRSLSTSATASMLSPVGARRTPRRRERPASIGASMNDVAEFLKVHPPCGDLSAEDLDRLAPRTHVEYFRAATTICGHDVGRRGAGHSQGRRRASRGRARAGRAAAG